MKGVQEQGGAFQARGITKGTVKGIVPCASDIMPICTYRAIVCVCCDNKELCLGYK